MSGDKDIELDQLQNLIDDQTDHNMRETLIISGIEGHDKTWEETRDLLSQKLEEVSENTINKDTISSAIIRAHRGGKDRKAIFVKFNNSYMVNKIKSLNFKRKGVYISQMRSPFVTARIKKALILRKSLTFRFRNTPYGDYGSSETHHMEIFYIGTRNNELTIQGVFQHLETLHI